MVQVLHEELMYANFVNPFRPGDAMTSLTYIHRVEQHPNGERSPALIRSWTGAPFSFWNEHSAFVEERRRLKFSEYSWRIYFLPLCPKGRWFTIDTSYDER